MMQVYLGEQLVGTVNVDPNSVRSKFYAIPIMEEATLAPSWDDEVATEVRINRLELKVGRRSHRIQDVELKMLRFAGLPEMLEAHRVPDYASTEQDMFGLCTVWSWPIFIVDLGQHEELFDLDLFEPV